MAVVQISKIQVRRGKKNSGSGLPQLASGELGWAVDTQELFIGNGSVSEGAPAVGNTQILTNESNIFQLANEYSYNSDLGYIRTGVTDNTKRTLQNKLDDFASAADFGMTGTSTQDVTTLLQNAVDQLYLNTSTKGTEKSRVVLYFPAGVYTITNTVYLPPHVNIVGEGIDNTVIRNTGSQTVCFVTVNEDSTPGSPAAHSTSTTANQSSHLLFRNCNLETTQNNTILQMDSCKDSIFENVKFKGAWSSTDGITSANSGIVLNNLSASVKSTNNRFVNCKFDHLSYAVYSDWDTEFNLWESCNFYDLGVGLGFGVGVSTLDSSSSSGIRTGAIQNKVENSTFKDVSQQAIYFKFGYDNVSQENTFEFVGNNQGADYEAAHPVLRFDIAGNASINDYFSRSKILSDNTYVGYPYINEIQGSVNHTSRYYIERQIGSSSTYVTRLRLPADTGVEAQQFKIRYHLNSLDFSATRSGELRVTCNGVSNTVRISDSYDYEGDANKELDFLFNATLTDVNGDSSDETILLGVKNDLLGSCKFRYSVELIK